jgi:hypothetical protein
MSQVIELSNTTKIFIGNGTALLQLAYNGVCSIVCPDSLTNTNNYYGFVSDIDFRYSYTEDLFLNQDRYSLDHLLDSVMDNIKVRNEVIEISKEKIRTYMNSNNLADAESNFFLKQPIRRLKFTLESICLMFNHSFNTNRLS